MRSLLLFLVACGKPAPGTPTDGDLAPPVATLVALAPTWVGDPVTLDASGSQGVSFSWDFGDGQSVTTIDARASHTWTRAGHFAVTLDVEGEDGTHAVASVALDAAWRPLDPAPRASTTLIATAHTIVAVLPDHDALALVDRTTRIVSTLETCGEPRSIAVGTDRIAVACTTDEVRLYDADLLLTGRVTLPWGSRPFGVVVDPTDDAVIVALQGTGELAWVDETGITAQVAVGPDLRGLAWTAEGPITSRHRSPEDEGELWRVGPNLPESWTLAADPGPDSDTDARGVPNYLERIAVRPDGRVAAVAGLKSNTARGLYRDGLVPTHETTARSIVRTVSLHPGEGAIGRELGEPHFDDRDRASALAFSPRGDWLWVAHQGARMVDLVDPYTFDRVAGFFVEGHGPDGLWVDPDTGELWVLASLSRELIVYDASDPLGAIPEVDRLALAPGRAEPLGAEGLLGKQVFYGSWDPRMTPSGYMSCASCHLDGDADGRTWDFTDRGEGLRNTISLQGPGGMGHGPLHWSANFDEIQDFEGDIRGPMAGTGFLSAADWAATSDSLGPPKAGRSPELDAMAAWLSTLGQAPRSPYRNPDGTLTLEAQTGQAIFHMPTVGCATCHPAPTYTDSGFVAPGEPLLHDVGTLTSASGDRLGGPLDGLDTPSLRGLHASAPYLHDGRHETIRELLDANADDEHGVTSVLAPSQLDALETFLLSIE